MALIGADVGLAVGTTGGVSVGEDVGTFVTTAHVSQVLRHVVLTLSSNKHLSAASLATHLHVFSSPLRKNLLFESVHWFSSHVSHVTGQCEVALLPLQRLFVFSATHEQERSIPFFAIGS